MNWRMQMLAEIEQQLAVGDLWITKQLDMIDYVRSTGEDTKAFETLLVDFRDVQQARFALRRDLLWQLYHP